MTRDNRLDENTKVPLGWIVSGVVTLIFGVVAVVGWATTISSDLTYIRLKVEQVSVDHEARIRDLEKNAKVTMKP